MINRLNFVLLVLLVVSSLYLVKVSYDGRRVYIELDRAKTKERALETEYNQLEVDRRAAAASLRVEKIAQEKLNMRTPTPSVSEYVTYARASASAASAGGVQ